MENASILAVDDEPDMLQLIKRSLEPDLNGTVTTASSGKTALKLLDKQRFDLVLLDIRMPEMDGLELLELIRRKWPDETVVMMTAYGTIETAVEAMKNGAFDFVTKPFDHDALIVRLEKALERSRLLRENRELKSGATGSHLFYGIAGKSHAMQRVFETIRMVAGTDMTVLITGESGTGKELTARAVHRVSPRRDAPFVAVNCPTVPEQILESELFGYRKGAFTHATRDKKGLFQEAQNGSIFLDEIGDVSPAIQAKLLRVIQEKEIKPLGSNRSIPVDVRIIASTNQDLKAKIREGTFREDLYYRLNVLPIELPPLRERADDILLIAGHLLEKHSAKLKKPGKSFSPELLECFRKRPWEGNVRELENAIIQGILFSQNDEIGVADIGLDAGECRWENRSVNGIDDLIELPYREAKEAALQRFNSEYIGRLLSETGGNVTQAARQCGLERQSLQQVIRRYGISAEDFRKSDA